MPEASLHELSHPEPQHAAVGAMDGRQPRLLKELWTTTQADVSPLGHQTLASGAEFRLAKQ